MQTLYDKINMQQQIMRNHGFNDWQIKTVVFLNKDEAGEEPAETIYGYDLVLTDKPTYIFTGIVTE